MKILKIFLFLLLIFGIIIFMIILEKEEDNLNDKIINNENNENIINNKNNINDEIKLYKEDNCEIIKKNFKVNGVSMEPLIKNGSEVELNLNYYNCLNNIPKSGDIVIFENPFTLKKVIKKLSISPGDKLKVDEETGIITINGNEFVNSVGEQYVFSDLVFKWFDIYTNEDGVVKDGIYFIFGDNLRNSVDSKNYGPVSLEGILGKVNY